MWWQCGSPPQRLTPHGLLPRERGPHRGEGTPEACARGAHTPLRRRYTPVETEEGAGGPSLPCVQGPGPRPLLLRCPDGWSTEGEQWERHRCWWGPGRARGPPPSDAESEARRLVKADWQLESGGTGPLRTRLPRASVPRGSLGGPAGPPLLGVSASAQERSQRWVRGRCTGAPVFHRVRAEHPHFAPPTWGLLGLGVRSPRP